MRDEMKKVPRLRFRGFSEDWELCKLGDSVRFINGRAYKQKELLDTGKYRVLRVGNFNTNDRWYYSDLELPEEKYANKGDLLYLWATSFGPEIWDNERVIYHYHIWKLDIIDPNIDKQYLNIWLETDKERIKQNTNGTTMVHVTKSNMEQREFKLPKLLAEQEKIGYFFKQINKTITLHQRKSDQLKELKKAYLQVMFVSMNTKNNKVPKLRFANFKGEWEQCKLGRMASFSKGNGYSKADLIEEGHPLILYGRLYTKYETIIESVDTFAKLQDKSILSKGGEVIVPSSGESAEDISRASVVDVAGVVLGGDLNIIKTNSELNPTFLALTISNGSQQKEMSKRAQGKSIVHLHNSDLKEINLLYPKIEEQIYIGLFFKKLEDTLNLHQNKLDQLKTLKKSYLQNMFI